MLAPAFHEKELQVFASSDGVDYRRHSRWFFGLPDLAKLSRLYERTCEAWELPQVFAEAAEISARPIKIVARYGGETPPH